MKEDIVKKNQKLIEEENTFKDLSNGNYFVNSPCLLTIPERTIRLNGIYLKAEGIYLISHIIGENYPCIWWLQDWEFIEN